MYSPATAEAAKQAEAASKHLTEEQVPVQRIQGKAREGQVAHSDGMRGRTRLSDSDGLRARGFEEAKGRAEYGTLRGGVSLRCRSKSRPVRTRRLLLRHLR